jgi:hypothetical protein
LPRIAVGVVTTVAITPLGAATYQLTYVATDDGVAPGTIPLDESVQKTVSLPASTAPWERAVVRGTGVEVDSVDTAGGGTDVTVTIPPPDDAGVTRMALHVTPYPRVLPASTLGAIHDVHPVLAIVSGVAVLFGPVLVLYGLLLDGHRPIAIPRWRWLRDLLDL